MERRASYHAGTTTTREDGLWQGFTLDSDPDEIPAAFERKHGYPMPALRVTGGGYLAGPLRVNHYDPAASDGQDGQP